MGMSTYWKQKKKAGRFKERSIEIVQSEEKTKIIGNNENKIP